MVQLFTAIVILVCTEILLWNYPENYRALLMLLSAEKTASPASFPFWSLCCSMCQYTLNQRALVLYFHAAPRVTVWKLVLGAGHPLTALERYCCSWRSQGSFELWVAIFTLSALAGSFSHLSHRERADIAVLFQPPKMRKVCVTWIGKCQSRHYTAIYR